MVGLLEVIMLPPGPRYRCPKGLTPAKDMGLEKDLSGTARSDAAVC